MGQETLFGTHGSALQLRSQRMEMLASNIANAATPGYRARDFDFAAALGKATHEGAQRGVSGAVSDTIGYRVPLEPTLDGNTVELATEQTAFAENAVQYRATLSFLETRVATIMSALKGD